MLTLEHVNNGANYYERLAKEAFAQGEYHTKIGSVWAKEWFDKTVEYANIANQLRGLVPGVEDGTQEEQPEDGSHS